MKNLAHRIRRPKQVLLGRKRVSRAFKLHNTRPAIFAFIILDKANSLFVSYLVSKRK